MTESYPTGLLLGGGGAKGAFQVGAWRVLQDMHYTDHLHAYAGCSVGALNAILFSLGDSDYAESIWSSIQRRDLMAKGGNGAFFSRDGLIRLLRSLPLFRLHHSKIPVYASVFRRNTMQTEYILLNRLPVPDIRTVLLATSAIPQVYAPVTFRHNTYVDGGVTPEGDHCIAPLYHEGHRNFLMLSLRHDFTLYDVQNSRFLHAGGTNLIEQYSDCGFTLIKPRKPLGNFITGTLNFTDDFIQKCMRAGAEDASILLCSPSADGPVAERNRYYAELMARLFPHAEQLEGFLARYADRFAVNRPMRTFGGDVWYDTIYAVDGWQFQHHRTVGLRGHYRFLNPNGERIAWILRPNVLTRALQDYQHIL